MGSHQAFALGRLRAKYLVWREEAVCIGVCACVGVSGGEVSGTSDEL